MSAKMVKKGKEGKEGKEGKGVVKRDRDGQKRSSASSMKDFEAKRGSGSRKMGVKDAKEKVRSSERGNE